jgi:hypothetical protein
MIENSLGGDDSANDLSNIEIKNQSIDSSLRSLSRGEEFLQTDILQVLNCQPAVSIINNILILSIEKQWKREFY